MKTARMEMRMRPDLKQQLQVLALSRGQSLSDMIHTVLEDFAKTKYTVYIRSINGAKSIVHNSCEQTQA